MHEEHFACLWADREALGTGALIDEQKHIKAELEATAKEACSLMGHSVGHVTLQAASPMAVKLDACYDHQEAPAVLQALQDFAGAG